MKSEGIVQMNTHTYDFNPSKPQDNRLYSAFLWFKELQKKWFIVKDFATIGTGPWIDSIGVYELFHPKNIYQIDIHPYVTDIAHNNATSLINNETIIETYVWDLCEPLIERDIKVDLLYANIPNIPSSGSVFSQKVSSSKFTERNTEDCPEVLQKRLLTLQYLFLKQAKEVLKAGGTIVHALWARMPYEIIKLLYHTHNYQIHELVNTYKIQTEAKDILESYAQKEKEEEIEFDFYDHEKAWPCREEGQKNKKTWTINELKEYLSPYKISATQAYKRFIKDEKQAGHICSILQATLNKAPVTGSDALEQFR